MSSTGGNLTTDRPSKSSCENLENVRLGCKIRHEAFHVNLGIDFSVNFIMCSARYAWWNAQLICLAETLVPFALIFQI